MDEVPRELVERARRRDAAAFGRLSVFYERAALAVAFGLVGDPAAAGDVVQEALMKAWKSVGELRDADLFAPWLMRIVRNAGLNYLRDHGPRQQDLADERLSMAVASPADAGPTAAAEQSEVSRRIEAALAGLDPLTRAVVMLKYFEGMTSRQIADSMDMTTAAVDMRLTRARGELRRRLTPSLDPHA